MRARPAPMDLSHVRFRAPRAPRPAVRPARHLASPHTSQDAGFADCVDGLPAIVLARAGLDAGAYRAAPLRRRVAACLRAVSASSETAALAQLEQDDTLHSTALNTLLIGVSSFFRDADVFTALRTRVVPTLAARPGTLRVISLGCSFGAEVYSLAMLLAEAGLLARAEVVGLDCRADAITAARSGLVDERTLAGLPPELRTRYLERTATGWRLTDTLRARITWAVDDITQRVAEGPWDLVLCRNVLMYLRSDVAATLCRRIVAALAVGGVVVLGKAERPAASFRLRTLAHCVHQFDGH